MHGHHHHGSHRHAHGGHDHAHSAPSGGSAEAARSAGRRILLAGLLTGGFMVAEVVGGILAGSLALLADAGHMLTDVGALALAYAGMRFARRPADPRRSFGYQRLEVLAAFVNGATLLALSAWIIVEAAMRFLDPVEVQSGTMLVIAVLGLVVNIASFLILRESAEHSLNVKGALTHVLGDLLGSIAAIAAALVIRFTGWMPIDPLLSILVALLIIRSGWDVAARSAHILLEGTPDDVDREAIRHDLSTLPGVAEVHHIHVWSLTSGSRLATLHLRPAPDCAPGAVLTAARTSLRDRFGIEHSTIEIDFDPPAGAPRPDPAATCR